MKKTLVSYYNFLKRGKGYYWQSTLALFLLIAITLWGERPQSLWALGVPLFFALILGIRAAEEKSRQSLFDLGCVLMWGLVMFLIICFG